MSSLNVTKQEDSESHNLGSAAADDSNDAEVDTSQLEEDEITQADNKSDDPRLQVVRQSFQYKMYYLCRELCFLVLIVFTYAAFQNTMLPKISKSPNAFPFFPQGCVVKDWYHGELSRAIELASESDLAFVMYYAPWDADSQSVRHEFIIAAQHMHKHIHFAAINCWQPGSECRQQYSKVYSWPVLMAYPAHGRGIQYRGPRKAEHMLKFLQSVANPITRINSALEITKYRALHDAVVVGFVDGRLGSSSYGVYYSVALRFLERDPFREVHFLVATGTHSSHMRSTDRFPALQLNLWNETLEYPAAEEWRVETLVSWISDSLHQVSVWVSPPGGKSHALSNYLQPGPALILFTPRNPLYTYNDYYSMLHDIALDYYNCDNNVIIGLQKYCLLLLRKEYYLEYKRLQKKCITSKKLNRDRFPSVVTYDVHKLWSNNTCDFKKTEHKPPVCAEFSLKKDTCSNMIQPSPKGSLAEDSYRAKQGSNPEARTRDAQPGPALYTETSDPRSPEHLVQQSEAERCKYFRLAVELEAAAFTAEAGEAARPQLGGLACRTNRSLSFLALDSLQHHHLAEGLGVDILNEPHKSAAVIVNSALETHHVLRAPLSAAGLRRFVDAFTRGALPRELASTAAPPRHTHLYRLRAAPCAPPHTCLPELTTANFLDTILRPNVAVVVLYHSAKCAFCSGVSHTLLTAARTLAPLTDLQFARIDGETHALPWEYAMHHYPSLLFFPATKKSESRVFPQNVPITVPNILSFILANAESNMKLELMWTLCKQTPPGEEAEQCVRSVRAECGAAIGRALRAYRRTGAGPARRDALLRRLQHLRALHFLLARPLRPDAIQHQFTMLRPS